MIKKTTLVQEMKMRIVFWFCARYLDPFLAELDQQVDAAGYSGIICSYKNGHIVVGPAHNTEKIYSMEDTTKATELH